MTNTEEDIRVEAAERRCVYEAVADGHNTAHQVSERAVLTESRVIFHLIKLQRAGWIHLGDEAERANRWYVGS